MSKTDQIATVVALEAVYKKYLRAMREVFGEEIIRLARQYDGPTAFETPLAVTFGMATITTALAPEVEKWYANRDDKPSRNSRPSEN